MKGIFFCASILFLFALSKKLLGTVDVHLHITSSQMITLFIIVVIAFIVLTFTQSLFKKVNKTNYAIKDSHLREYIKPICFSIFILATIMILSQTFEVLGQMENSLVLMSFLLIILLVKIKFINFLTIETFGYFLFYMKSVDRNLQINIIKNIQINNYIFLLPILLIHSSYLLIQQNFIFLGILFSLYILDIKTDELVIQITRKVVKKSELPNLFIHSKKGLSSVLLIAFFPVTLISLIVKSNQSTSVLMGTNMLIILSLLIACVALVAHTWKRSFFEDLYK
ncbi:hypothetical protein [Peribacillus frigoritolerans]|uniref:hypothetical protein n=1 Tax=Peribacillus frigoritolerans TaxID=450367 RepID=UPI0020C14C5A|nr:hypothetical protein [Peribacillus frigoritolerans]MEE3954653.1 hypothetical protein [Peribacillus frigoritolerans]